MFDYGMLISAQEAFLLLVEPQRMMMLSMGVLIGLALGIIPGLGGLVGLALILPFTYNMDPYTAFAVMLGLLSVTSTSDTIPAVLFGVPGTANSQATILDGHPMAKRGEAGRALSAAYVSSLIGAIFGALMLVLTIPFLRELVLRIGSPELLAISVLGISMVAALSGSAPLRGLVIGCFGVMLAFVGIDPQSGTERWTFDTLYLWDGLSLVPVTLGLFALPEIADMAIKRISIAKGSNTNLRSGTLKGIGDAFRNWWLVLRSGGLGAIIGSIPGLGAAVTDWIVYAHAMQTSKGGQLTFGKGDVRGVIAPESANNALTAGSLVPTLAFGMPGSATMAILLGAFMIQGIAPGPNMLTTELTLTYAMVWSVALANILGAGICLAFSGYLAKIAMLRYTILIPIIVVIVYVGAFQATRHWGDIYVLLGFGVLGWFMKQLKWPRPPLILGLVLGAIVERYLFISLERYGWEWLNRPLVLVLLGFALLALMSPLIKNVLRKGLIETLRPTRPKITAETLMYIPFLGAIAYMLLVSLDWTEIARIAPVSVASLALAVGAIGLLYSVFGNHQAGKSAAGEEGGKLIHMDVASLFGELDSATVTRRAFIFLAWVTGFGVSMAVVGIFVTIPLFVVLYMWLEGREKWYLIVPQALTLTLFVYFVFDRLLSLPWPDSLFF